MVLKRQCRNSGHGQDARAAMLRYGEMRTALVACGALVREVLCLKEKHGWDADVLAVDALLHNRPEGIPAAVRARIREAKQKYQQVVVVYGDCGTTGLLDEVLAEEGVERVRGPHCYAMFAGPSFERLMAEEPGTFFLTDYLLNSFESLVIKGLGLDRFPELRDVYFDHYKRAVYLVQRPDPALEQRAKKASEALRLPLEIVFTGYGALETDLLELVRA